ncbi:MAG: hypothetical protein WAV50_01260 [Minisyncoccia bacterium]
MSLKEKAVFAPQERTGRSGTLGTSSVDPYVQIEHLDGDGNPIAIARETRLVAQKYVERHQARFV